MRLRCVLIIVICFCTSLTIQGQDTGVLIMAHGGSDEWNKNVKEAAEPLEALYPVEFSWGMANYVTLQKAIWKLEEKEVSKIVAVPLFISSYSPIIRQTEYLFGMRDSLADSPMPLMHHTQEYVEMTGAEVDSSNYFRGMLMPPNLQPLDISTKIIMAKPLDDHDVVAKILHKRIAGLSEQPARETVILAAHGPNRENDNKRWVANLESLSMKIQKLQEEQGPGFKQIFALTVRDDAPDAIFNQAMQNFRSLVRQANRFSDVIVVPVFLSSGGREQAIAGRLKGLDFRWNGKTLLPDSLLTEFLMNSVAQSLSGKGTVN